jgi:hypothetical protein
VGQHSQNVAPDLVVALSYAPYFEKPPTLGLYPIHIWIMRVMNTIYVGWLGNKLPNNYFTFVIQVWQVAIETTVFYN